jgi:hypothetical protein
MAHKDVQKPNFDYAIQSISQISQDCMPTHRISCASTFEGKQGIPSSPSCSKWLPPLDVSVWAAALSQHPDRAFARYICQGLQFGFWIGFNGTLRLKSTPVNMGSAREHPAVVSEYLVKKLTLGRMLGPFPKSASMAAAVHINRFGVIPKGHNTGRWRLITDLSFPCCQRRDWPRLVLPHVFHCQ